MKKQYLIFMGMGFEFTALIVVGILIGRKLDAEYHLKGLGVAGGCLGALILWSVHLFQAVKALESSDKAENEDSDERV